MLIIRYGAQTSAGHSSALSLWGRSCSAAVLLHYLWAGSYLLLLWLTSNSRSSRKKFQATSSPFVVCFFPLSILIVDNDEFPAWGSRSAVTTNFEPVRIHIWPIHVRQSRVSLWVLWTTGAVRVPFLSWFHVRNGGQFSLLVPTTKGVLSIHEKAVALGLCNLLVFSADFLVIRPWNLRTCFQGLSMLLSVVCMKAKHGERTSVCGTMMTRYSSTERPRT